jgi:hypothetical protein
MESPITDRWGFCSYFPLLSHTQEAHRKVARHPMLLTTHYIVKTGKKQVKKQVEGLRLNMFSMYGGLFQEHSCLVCFPATKGSLG